MKPSIGRIVNFYSPTGEEGNANVIVLPAIIVKVYNQTCVALQIFPNNVSGIMFRDSVVQGTQLYHWNWPIIENKDKLGTTTGEIPN